MPDEAIGAQTPLDWMRGPEPPSLQLVPPPWLNRDETLAPRPDRPDLGRPAACFQGYQAEEPLRDIRGPSGSALVGLLPSQENLEIPSMAKETADPNKEPINKMVFRKQFKKTQMCRFFQRSACRKGYSCEFAHGPQELAQPPDLRRTSICKAFMEGCCPESAETCRFAHGIAMLRRTQGFEKVVLNKEPQAEDTAGFGYEQVQLHLMLRQQQRGTGRNASSDRRTTSQDRRAQDAAGKVATGTTCHAAYAAFWISHELPTIFRGSPAAFL